MNERHSTARFWVRRAKSARAGRAMAGVLPALVIAAGLAGCTPRTAASTPSEVVVFAAASLTDAFGDIAQGFETRRPGTRVVLNFASSSQLARQLAEGAPADVFASASPSQMQVAVDAGRIHQSPETFATNALTLIVPAENPAEIDDLAGLVRPGVAIILASSGVPVREYTDRMLDRLASDPNYGPGYASAFRRNVVSEETDVRQVVAKIALGEGDVGVVYQSDITPDVAAKIRTIPVPEPFNVKAVYPIAAVDGAPNPEEAQAFVAYVLGPEGQATLHRWGFGPKP